MYRSLYAVGGRDENEMLSHVEKYNLQFGTWNTVAPLPQRLRCSTAVSYGGKLYVFGGESPTAIVNTAYRSTKNTVCYCCLLEKYRIIVLHVYVVHINHR